MKKKENLASTNQLIRFIRGDVKYDEFFEQPSQIENNRKPLIIFCSFSLLVATFILLAGYLILSRQLSKKHSV